MAISYNDWKKSYEELDAAWKQKFVDLAKNSDIGKQYMQQYASEIGGTKNTWTTSTSSNTWSTNTNNNTSNTWTSTSTTWTTGGTTWTTWTSTNNTAWYNQVKPEEVSTRTNANNTQVNDLAYQWNKLSYEQQQEKLKQTPALKQSLANLGITIKWPESTTWTTWTSWGSAWTTWETTGWTTGGKGWDEWDYQDNSQARMDEILKHLNDYRVTNPSLFSNYDDFYNFFIAGKGRSPEQIKVLNDYFNNTKAYNSYDNMSSSDIGYLMVHWGNSTVDDYVNLLKSTDPQRYAEIQTARKDEEDKIKSNSTLDTISDMMWEWDNETLWKNKVLNWMKENWMFVDKDWNLVDDRLENYASEEEKGYQKEIADLYADILDIDNTVKHTYEDLRDRYPWASKSTLMAMANDRNSDLLREREDKMVTITKLQGYVGYMQENRKEMNDAGKLTIANLQKQYWMYYEYSPEGIKERAKAEYEATHPTLEAAENGTDTEKHMALDSYLTGYFDKYWDIIERPKEQVIQDAMTYAKNNWVSLSEAVNETFTKYLKEKPWFKQLNSVWGSYTPKWTKIWTDEYGNDMYGFVDEQNMTVNPYGNVSMGDIGYGTWWTWGTAWSEWSNGNQVILEWDPKTDTGIPNVYWNTVKLKSEVWDKLKQAYDKLKNEYGITLAIWDSYVSPEYKDKMVADGKAGNVSWSKSFHSKGQAFDLDQWVDSNKSEIVSQVLLDAWFTRAADWEWWHWSYWEWPDTFGWTKSIEYWYWEHPMYDTYMNLAWLSSLNADQKSDLKFSNQLYWVMYRLASSWNLDHLLRSSDWQKVLANLKNSKFIQEWKDVSGIVLFDALKNNITDQRNLQTVNDLITAIELKLRKTSWAAIAASEWSSNFDMLLPLVWEDYSVAKHKYENFEQEYLMPYFDYAGAGSKRYKWYIPLFSPDSKYYKQDQTKFTLNWNWKFNTPTYFESSWAGDSQNKIYYNWQMNTRDNIRSNGWVLSYTNN